MSGKVEFASSRREAHVNAGADHEWFLQKPLLASRDITLALGPPRATRARPSTARARGHKLDGVAGSASLLPVCHALAQRAGHEEGWLTFMFRV